jgi:tetratricopeptide (TPR) repeat protein
MTRKRSPKDRPEHKKMRIRATKKPTKKANVGSALANAKTKNGNKGTGSCDKTAKAIDRLLAAEKWQEAQSLLHWELIHAPTDHYWWMMLSETYYEQFEYETALECAKRAVELAPQCPLALWHYAGCLSMTGQERAALAVWTLLLNRDLDEIAYGEGGEGMKWAMQLLNDVHYRMGFVHQFLGEDSQARVSFEKYLENRRHGVSSIYDAADVKKAMVADAVLL